MSTPPDKPTPPPAAAAGVSWETLERVAIDAERRRLETASDEQIAEDLRNAGIDPAEADRIFDAAVAEADRRSTEGAAGDASPDTRGAVAEEWPASARGEGAATLRGRWALALVAAAVVLLVLFAWKRREIVAFLQGSPEPIGPDRELVPEPDHVQHGQWVRRQALEACSMDRWDDCRRKLDEAKRLDPAGESDPDVVKARADIAAATALPPEQGDARIK